MFFWEKGKPQKYWCFPTALLCTWIFSASGSNSIYNHDFIRSNSFAEEVSQNEFGDLSQKVRGFLAFDNKEDFHFVEWSSSGHYLIVENKSLEIVEVIRIRDKVSLYSVPYGEKFVSTVVNLSPNEKYLAIALKAKQSESLQKRYYLDILDLEVGQKIASFEHEGSIGDLHWSPDSQNIATVGLERGRGDNIVRAFSVGSNRELFQIAHNRGPRNAVNSFRWSPDSKYIATASRNGNTHIFSVSAHSEIMTIFHNQPVLDINWSPNSDFISTISLGGTKVVNILTQEELSGFGENSDEAFWSPDGKYISTDSFHDSRITNYSFVDMQEVSSIEYERMNYVPSQWSPDSRYIAAVESNNSVAIMNIENAQNIISIEHKGIVSDIAWSFDSRYLATVYDGKIKVFDTVSSRELKIPEINSRSEFVYWNPSGQYLVVEGFSPKPTVTVLLVHE
ncbi:MAG: hypothetical protein F6J87_20515 [Spirulina sp. SIO3F2]|nr:hypothetical protein [Spirulina sp. SIO3F2]